MTTVEIASMPVSEKLKLMETLWDSLCAHATAETPAWHEQVLEDRMRHLASGEETVVPGRAPSVGDGPESCIRVGLPVLGNAHIGRREHTTPAFRHGLKPKRKAGAVLPPTRHAAKRPGIADVQTDTSPDRPRR